MQRSICNASDEDYYGQIQRMGSLDSFSDRALTYVPLSQQQQTECTNRQSHTRESEVTARRRIKVACGRCRKRKIKCTGDPGDGSGCGPCKSAGSSTIECVFARVGSHIVTLSDSRDAQYDHTTIQPALYQPRRTRAIDHRASLPALHTSISYPRDHSQHLQNPYYYDISSRSSVPSTRSYSLSNTYNYQGQYPASLPTNLTYGYNVLPYRGSMSSNTGQYNYAYNHNISEYADENLSAMNMNSLSASLPVQQPQERRLPTPHTMTLQHHLHESRAREFGFRPNHCYDRSALSWTSAREERPSHSVSTMSDTVLGYQFRPATTYDSDIRPATRSGYLESPSFSPGRRPRTATTERVPSTSMQMQNYSGPDYSGLYSYSNEGFDRAAVGALPRRQEHASTQPEKYNRDDTPAYKSPKHKTKQLQVIYGYSPSTQQYRQLHSTEDMIHIPTYDGRL